MIDDETAALIGAAIAWFDTEAAFGAGDPRSMAAKEKFRQRVARCVQQADDIEPNRPAFTVIPGGVE
jgi:hypothetical protein